MTAGAVDQLLRSVWVCLDAVELVEVLATHEQVLGGATGQVYTGCRFPADPVYAAEFAGHGRAVGEKAV